MTAFQLALSVRYRYEAAAWHRLGDIRHRPLADAAMPAEDRAEMQASSKPAN
jgi:hypothetical protein